jgi:uncharacterized membrane protein
MASKYDDLKKDLDTLFQVQRELENKIEKKVDEGFKEIHTLGADVTIIKNNISTVVEKVASFVDTFEKHDANEMDKYNKIQEELTKLNTTSNENNTKIKEMEICQTKIKETQSKFIKIFWIGTGVVTTIVAMGSLILFILDLMSKIPK